MPLELEAQDFFPLARSIDLIQQSSGISWELVYHVQYLGNKTLIFNKYTNNIEIAIKGEASNSKIEEHSTPHAFEHTLDSFSSRNFLGSYATILPMNETRATSCYEKIEFIITKDFEHLSEKKIEFLKSHGLSIDRDYFEVKKGEEFYILIYLTHHHRQHGLFDPLYGTREFKFSFGEGILWSDTTILPTHQRIRRDKNFYTLTPPTDKLSKRFFYSPPDSIELISGLAKDMSQLIFQKEVENKKKYRLFFRFFNSKYSSSHLKVFITEQSSLDNQLQNFSDQKKEYLFTSRGEWQNKEIIFRTGSQTNMININFELEEDSTFYQEKNIKFVTGEAWIDDVFFNIL